MLKKKAQTIGNRNRRERHFDREDQEERKFGQATQEKANDLSLRDRALKDH